MSDIPFSEKPHHISTKTENRGYVQCHFTEPHCTLEIKKKIQIFG